MAFAAMLFPAAPALRGEDAAAHVPPEARPRFEVRTRLPEAVHAEALALLEAAWPAVVEWCGAPKEGFSEPLVVNLYATSEEFEAAEAEVAGGAMREHRAFASPRTGEAYVALSPPLPAGVLERFGLPLPTKAALAHELAHLAAQRTFADYARLPAWVKEGLACGVERRTLEAVTRRSAADLPFFATRQARVRLCHESKGLPPWDELLEDELRELSRLERYAVHQVLFDFLSEGDRAAVFRDALRAAREKTRRIHPHAEACEFADALAKGSGPLAADFSRYVAELRPSWQEGARSLEPRGDSWLHCAYPDQAAYAVRPALLELPLLQSGEVERLTPRAEPSLLLELDDEWFVAITFGPARTQVSLRPPDTGTAESMLLLDDPRAVSTYALTLDGETLQLELEGQRHVVALPEPFAGRIGVAINAGEAALWSP